MLVPTISIEWRPIPRVHSWRSVFQTLLSRESGSGPAADLSQAPGTRHLRRDIGILPETVSPTYLDLM